MKQNFIEKIEKITNRYTVPVKQSKYNAWMKLEQKIDNGGLVVKSKRARNSTQIVIGWVAAAAVFLAIMYMGMFYTGKFTTEYYAPCASIQEVKLPDSSKIILNSNSKAKYHYNKITGERIVVLNGEAFFKVEKGRKFTVNFDGGKINVTGTKFNVIAYNKDYLNINCTEGSIELCVNKQNMVLKAGEGASAYNGKLTVPFLIKSENIDERLYGIYYWNKISVDKLVHLIGYRFGYKVELHPEMIKRNFSGKIDLSDLNNALNIVSYAMDLNYFIDNEKQIITVNDR